MTLMKLIQPDKGTNVLQSCLFSELACLEHIAGSRLFSILYLSIVLPVRWLAAKTHKLSNCEVKGFPWGVRSMGLVVDVLYAKCNDLIEDPTKIIDEGFMMGLFDDITDNIPDYQKFKKYMYEDKKSLFIARVGNKVVPFRLLKDELFNPQDNDNQATNDLMPELGKITAKAIIDDFEHKLKVTRHYVSAIGGRLSWDVVTAKEKHALVKKRATNDSAESAFSSFTEMLNNYQMIDMFAASGTSDIRINGYMR